MGLTRCWRRILYTNSIPTPILTITIYSSKVIINCAGNISARSNSIQLHESRHLHALKRAGGCGGRFLTAKKTDNQQKQDESGDKSQVNINLESGKDEVASSENAS
ncbi:hypothetical protein K7X08_017857 [Anisodus acutangulus]|uniref:Nuclear transcription factor Y subunit n=1 Tax=Anisodus acutangulus TaxID=402998 RepID=A0A9Q1LVX6_9SOLA|nr:hypothetical protein K7X08_017857 [Anisodus acutangulus]